MAAIGDSKQDILEEETQFRSAVSESTMQKIGGAINYLNTTTDSHTTSIATNASGISTNAGNISTNATNISTNAGNISTNAGDITSLDGRVTTLESAATEVSDITKQDATSSTTVDASTDAYLKVTTPSASTTYTLSNISSGLALVSFLSDYDSGTPVAPTILADGGSIGAYVGDANTKSTGTPQQWVTVLVQTTVNGSVGVTVPSAPDGIDYLVIKEMV